VSEVLFGDSEHAFIVALSLWLLDYRVYTLNGREVWDKTRIVTPL
jgi:hypothetical protein